MAQEGLFVRYRHCLSIDMETQHCLLDEVLGVFP
jgi:hypothetical protein